MRPTRTAPAVLATALFLCGSAPDAGAQEGGIEVFAAETLFDKGTRVSLTHIYKREGSLYRGSDDVRDPLDRTFEEHRVVLGVDHGIRRDLTVSVLVPWVSKELDSNAGTLRSDGLGDVAVLAKYRAYKRDWSRSAFHVALIGGVETPTGDTRERDGGGRLPPRLQPGSGSWDPFVSVSANVDLDRQRYDAQVFYKLNTEGDQDFEKGDFFALELDAAYRFLHTKYPGPTASAKVGLQWRHESRAERAGSTVSSSGYDELRLRPGVTWHPAPNWDVKLAVDVPLYQDVNGEQLALDYRTFLAFGLRF